MPNIQIIDGAENATFTVYEVTDEQFSLIFPGNGQDLEIIEAVAKRLKGNPAGEALLTMWDKPLLKSDTQGIHGTLFYNYYQNRHHLPKSKREIDRNESQLPEPVRALYRKARGEPAG